MSKIFKNIFFQLAVLVLVGLSARLYKLNTPLADWHSWRQSDTASVTREFVKNNYSIFLPHYQDLSSISNGLDNLDGLRMVEFPFSNFKTAQLLRAFPNLDLVSTSRMVSILHSLVSILALYLIVYELSRDRAVSFFSALVLAIMPYSVYYSRTILPEPIMLSYQLLGLLLFILYLNKPRAHIVRLTALFFLSSTTLAFSLLAKPTAVFIAPVLILIAVYKLGWKSLQRLDLWLFGLVVTAPLLTWRSWIQNFPEGIPASDWLLNGNGIRLRPAWWRWLFAERVAKLMLGYWGTVFVALGVLSKSVKKRELFDLVTVTWSLSMILYLVVFATGNVQHDYYQVMLTPIVSILFARGALWLWRLPRTYISRTLLLPLLGLIASLSLYLSWYEVRGYYNINNPAIVKAGQRVDQLTSADAKVIAPYGGDTAFLFQTNRTGWPIGGDISSLIEKGATHYVTTTLDDEANKLLDQYQIIEQTGDYLILDLTE